MVSICRTARGSPRYRWCRWRTRGGRVGGECARRSRRPEVEDDGGGVVLRERGVDSVRVLTRSRLAERLDMAAAAVVVVGRTSARRRPRRLSGFLPREIAARRGEGNGGGIDPEGV